MSAGVVALPTNALRDFENVRISEYVSAAGFVILLFDHILTFDDEVEYIWSAPRTLARTFFLIQRYMVPTFLFGQILTHNGMMTITMSSIVRACKAWMSIALYAGWLSIFISNFLVLMRLWTLLPRNHRLIPWTLVFLFATQLISFGTTTWALVLMLRVMFWDSKLELCSLYSKPQVVELWVVGLAFEVLVFLVVCWNALSRPRSLQSPEEDPAMRRLLFRDGFLYFSILFVLRIANTIISSVAPISLLFVAVFFIWAGTSVTTSRLIINARRAAGSNARQRTEELQRLPTRESAVVTLYKDSG